jgi:hypothetical protein
MSRTCSRLRSADDSRCRLVCRALACCSRLAEVVVGVVVVAALIGVPAKYRSDEGAQNFVG